MTCLHITSDEKTAQSVRRLLDEGSAVAWEDTIYEGPLMPRWKDFYKARAKYFANTGCAQEKAWRNAFNGRLDILKSAISKANRVILWFGPGFHEQLQLCAFLDWLEGQKKAPPVAIVPFPERKTGSFSQFNVVVLRAMMHSATDLTLTQIEIAKAVWQLLLDDNPTHLPLFSRPDISTMPHIMSTLQRWLEEFPSRRNGLSRTQRTVIEIVANGSRRLREIYQTLQVRENGLFLNEAMFTLQVKRLLECPQPALYLKRDFQISYRLPSLEQVARHDVGLTSLGWDLLQNKGDFVQANGIDRWLGGVHLRDDNIWRWDAVRNSLVKTYV
jgi:hypothetical protein